MKNKIYDILVVGSGLSSLSFIDGYLEKNKSINVISFKKSQFFFENIDNSHILKILPPQMIGAEKQVQDYFSLNKIKIRPGTNFFGSLEFGGLSNYWGLQIDQNIYDDIKHLSKKIQNDIKKSFIDIFENQKLIGKINEKYHNIFSKSDYIDENILKKDKEIILTEPILAFSKKRNDNKKINLEEINEKKDKLTAKNYFNKNLKNKNIRFHNYFVKKIKNHRMGVLLNCFDGKKNKDFITKKLILGCGTLVTTKLIMDYLNISKVVKINHHPRLFSVYFSKKKWSNNMFFQPSHLHLKAKKTPDLFTADFRPGNKIIIDAIIKFKKFLIPFKFFLNLIREHFIFSNCFLNSRYGNLYLRKKKSNFEVYSKNKKIDKVLKKIGDITFKFLKKTKKIFPLRLDYFPGFGADFHYFGTILIKKKGELTVNEKCQLNKDKRIYIVDGSTLNFKKNKYPLGLIMANARRISKDI